MSARRESQVWAGEGFVGAGVFRSRQDRGIAPQDMFAEGRRQTGEVRLSPRPHHDASALADVTAAKMELRDRRPSVQAGRQRTGLARDWTEWFLQGHWGSGTWDRRIWVGWLWRGGHWTDLLDNGFT